MYLGVKFVAAETGCQGLIKATDQITRVTQAYFAWKSGMRGVEPHMSQLNDQVASAVASITFSRADKSLPTRASMHDEVLFSGTPRSDAPP